MQSNPHPPNKKANPFKGIWKRRTKGQKATIIVTILLAITFLFIVPRPLTVIIINHSRTDHYINVTVSINGAKVIESEIYNSGTHFPSGMKDYTILVWGSIYHIDVRETDNNVASDTMLFAPIGGGYEEITYSSPGYDSNFYFSYSLYHPVYL